MSETTRTKLGALCLVGLIVAACGSTRPANFHLLRADASPAAGIGDGEGKSLGVGPIVFPEYLDRPQMVVRGEGSRLDLRETERWAEPLSDNFVAVLVENLAGRTGSDGIYGFGWPGNVELDYRLTGRVSRFEVEASGEAVLAIQWRITAADGAPALPTRRSRYVESSPPGDYAEAAAALSRTVAAFSDDVAAALADL